MIIKRVRVPMIPVGHKNRMGMVEVAVLYNELSLTSITALAVVTSAIDVYEKAKGTKAIENGIDVENLKTIAISLGYELNEVMHFNMELLISSISSVLSRMYPMIYVKDKSLVESVMAAVTGASAFSDDTTIDINDKLYSTKALYSNIIALFDYKDAYRVVVEEDTLVISKL